MPEPRETTYTRARATLAALCDEVASTREPIIIRRRNAADVALVSADELEGLLETAHLMRSPENAHRLLRALERALELEGEESTLGQLRPGPRALRGLNQRRSGGVEARYHY